MTHAGMFGAGAAAPVFPGDVVVIDATHATVAEAWVADTFPANVTNVRVAKDFTFHSGVSAAIFVGVTVAVDEGVALTLNNSGSQNSITLGAVTLNGPGSVAVTDTIDVSSAVSGMAALTISGTVNVPSGGSIANAVAGSGTIAYAAIPAATPSSYTGWTGTVALPAFTGGEIALNNYGVADSTVRVSTSTIGYLSNATVLPTVELGGDWTLPQFSASFANEFTAITGSGMLTLGATLDVTADNWYSNYSAFLKIGSVAGFTGSITLQSNGPGIVIGGAKPAYREPGGKILVYGNVTVGETATWTAPNGVILADANATLVVPSGATVTMPTTSVAGCVVKATAGESTTVYSVAAQRTATVSVGSNVSLTINGDAVADGDTLKFVPGDVLTIAASADTYYTPALTVNGVAQTSPYELTTTDADVTVSVTATLDTYTITIPSVANTTVSVSYTSGGEAQVATAAGAITVDAGTSLTATWTAVSGYRITANAGQTINPVLATQTLTSPAVEEMSAVVSNVNFTYGADYTTAEVTATIAGEATSATLTYGSNTYNAQVSNGTVTFTDVVVSRDSGNIYAPVSYIITTDAHATTGGAGSAVAADTTSWFSQSSANSGVPVNGSWTTAVNLSTPTNVTDNTFTTTESTSSRVVLEFNVCFSSVSDADVDGDAQGALKLGEVNSVTTFMVLTNGNQWAAVSNVGLTPDPTATNKVVMTFDYANNTYSVSVDNYELTDGSGSSSFPLAASRTGVKDIDFAGTGTLVSMKGDQVEGYMVVDKNGMRYPSIAAAISAYTQDPSIGPLKLLHAGTAPSGWRIDGDTLIKAAKGLFFMAF